MKICIINGSPKGKYSTTLQTSLYLQKKFPCHDFSVLNVGQHIETIEKNQKKLKQIIEEMKNADLTVFSYPVYTFIAPSQLHRFMELIKPSQEALKGKFVTQITTSKHFYDMTAHRYIEENCHDMRMKVIHGLSADMDDLLTEKGQEEALSFFKYATFCIENNIYEAAPERISVKQHDEKFHMGVVSDKSSKYIVAIVADIDKGDEKNERLERMIAGFRDALPYETHLINIREYEFKGGCLGCFNCAGDGKCIYDDGFDDYLRNIIQKADALVYGFSVKDHSMGARFKMYDDRQFCNGHRIVTEGMPFGYIVSGDYPHEENLKTIIGARCEVGHNFLSGVGYDSETLTAMSQRLVYALENKYLPPRNFYGVGGMKIFRDLIWLMRGLMKADHEFYKKHGVYDFPQKQRGKMIKMSIIGALIRNPKVKAKMQNSIREKMIEPYKKIIEGRKEEE